MFSALIPLALALAACHANAQVQTSWVNQPGGVSVARDAADNVYTALWDFNPAGDITLTKRNAAGAVLWQVAYDNTDNTRHEVATWVATDSVGNVWVSGTLRSGISNPVNVNSLLMKFAPNGSLLWRRTYGNDFDGSSTRRFVLDAQDRAYVLGLGTGPAGQVSTVRQFLPDGSTGWVWYDSQGIGAPVMIKRTPDQQTLVIARGVTGLNNGYAKINASGQTVWSVLATNSQTVGDAVGDAAGRTFTVDGDGAGTVLRRFTPDGTGEWFRSHPMQAFRVELAPDGGPVLGGYPTAGAGLLGAAFAKFSADGTLLWTQADGDGPSVGLIAQAQLLVDSAGSAYLAGTTLFEMGVAKVNADGTRAGTGLAAGGTAAAFVLGSQGQVYLTGGQTARLDFGPPPPTVDLALTLTDAPDPVKVGGTLVYTATVTNGGNTAAPATYTQALPRTVTWLGATPSQGSCTGGRTVSCNLGSVPAGGTATVSVMVQARSRGTLSGSASVSTTATDVNPANNSATTSTTVKR
jgi:hypothetical protein